MGSARMRRRASAASAAALLLGAWFAPGDAGESRAQTAVAECEGAEQIELGCYKRRYRAMTSADGPRAAIRDLRAHAARVGYLRSACHQLMHVIGRQAGREDGLRSFAEGDDTCSSGFYHGIVEAVMRDTGASALERDPAGVCAPFRDSEPQGMAHYNCVHGMGHGFMDVYGGDVFRSLDGCDELDTHWERHHCEGGVFMENLTSMTRSRSPPGHLRPEQPLYPCTAVAARYKHECYMKQTAYALFVRDDDFSAVFALCAASPDLRFRADCYEGLGGDASIHSSKYLTGRGAARRGTLALCRLGLSRAARRGCVVGAITVIVRDGASQATGAVEFCTALRDRGLRAACSRAHLATVRDLTNGRGGDQQAELGTHGPAGLCRLADRLEKGDRRESG